MISTKNADLGVQRRAYQSTSRVNKPFSPRFARISPKTRFLFALSALVQIGQEIMRKRHRSSSKDKESRIADISSRQSADKSSDDESLGSRRPHTHQVLDPATLFPLSAAPQRGMVLLRGWLILICFHVFPLSCLAAGMAVCFTRLYTAGECEMTYSRRTFIEIPVAATAVRSSTTSTENDTNTTSSTSSSSSTNTLYRLWKFVDERDPRGTQSRDDFCRPNVPLVLYVPGHYGSYEQSRSIGAHGTQLTGRLGGTAQERRIVQALAETVTTRPIDHAPSLDSFFYDVYAVDFLEEGSAFHGAILQRQAHFIAATIDTLTRTCERNHMFIVAHSFGGISSQLAVANDAMVRNKVAAIITLATPHAFPVWTWEPQVFNVYHAIAVSRPEVPTISICGDYRDEMIPPDACDAGGEKLQQISIHASDIANNCSIGMDHRAIVWCHNVLSQVRSLLYVLEYEAKKAQPDIMAVTSAWLQSRNGLNVSHYDYLDRTKSVKAKLMVRTKWPLFSVAQSHVRFDSRHLIAGGVDS
jgi:PGAP1-like protein